MNAFHLAELLKEGIGGLPCSILLCALLLRDLVDGLEVSQGVEPISHYPHLLILVPFVLTFSLFELLLVDDQLL